MLAAVAVLGLTATPAKAQVASVSCATQITGTVQVISYDPAQITDPDFNHSTSSATGNCSDRNGVLVSGTGKFGGGRTASAGVSLSSSFKASSRSYICTGTTLETAYSVTSPGVEFPGNQPRLRDP